MSTAHEPPPRDQTDSGSADGRAPAMPRWVKVSVIVLGIVVLVAAAVMLLSGGDHGPGRHLGEGAAPATSALELARV
ncbi:hypothetical protein [Agrococcus beijingensis]|uniref:hypothetical protein n=1 Tax=Agrococcus beijingensis TaxID=3068634 RepID=UPI0027429888|nr:hypothetical protein [Agrococcus sp. REN33]